MAEYGDGSEFGQLIGRFGTNANPQQRARAERLAMMKPDDGRRKQGGGTGLARPCQFNVRITAEARALALQLVQDLSARDGRPWSQADLIEEAIGALARSLASAASTKEGAA